MRDSVEEGLSRSSKVGDTLVRLGEKAKEATKQFLIPGMFFEDMGFTYLGPVDGHDVRLFQETLVRALNMGKPVVIHAVTKKGLGYAPAQANPEAFHGVAPFDIATGEIRKSKGGAPTYTSVFSQRLIAEAEVNPCIVAITAAMPAGTGLELLPSGSRAALRRRHRRGVRRHHGERPGHRPVRARGGRLLHVPAARL